MTNVSTGHTGEENAGLLEVIERQVYRRAYGQGYEAGWRAGSLFERRSLEQTAQAIAALDAEQQRFREAHQRDRAKLTGGAA